MDLAAIRAGLVDVLGQIEGVRPTDLVPAQLPSGSATVAVLVPASTYVQYPESRGDASRSRALVAFELTLVPSTADLRTAQLRLDELLSQHAGKTRSVRRVLNGSQSLGGAACIVNVLTARIAEIEANGVTYVVAVVDIEVEALCS